MFILVPIAALGVPTAYLAACVLGVESRRARPKHQCPSCDYPRAGLAADAVCPECGAAAPGPDTPLVVMDGGPYATLLLSAMIIPVLQAVLAPDAHLLLSSITWLLAYAVVRGWIAIVRPRVPLRPARTALRASVAGFLVGDLLLATFMVLKYGGVFQPLEYGAAFDIAITGFLFGPPFAAGVAGWFFVVAAGAWINKLDAAEPRV